MGKMHVLVRLHNVVVIGCCRYHNLLFVTSKMCTHLHETKAMHLKGFVIKWKLPSLTTSIAAIHWLLRNWRVGVLAVLNSLTAGSLDQVVEKKLPAAVLKIINSYALSNQQQNYGNAN